MTDLAELINGLVTPTKKGRATKSDTKSVKIGQRGKDAEKKVDAVLRKLNNQSSFTYWRLPDSRAARGFLAAQPGDFAYFSKGRGGIIEVKSTEHASRLPKSSISQLANLKKLELAGAQSIILVFFSTVGLWRYAVPSQLPIDAPSWDFSQFVGFASAEEALLSTGWF